MLFIFLLGIAIEAAHSIVEERTVFPLHCSFPRVDTPYVLYEGMTEPSGRFNEVKSSNNAQKTNSQAEL